MTEISYNGNDVLEGGTSADTLNGGAGRDVISFANSDAGVTVKLWDDVDLQRGHPTTSMAVAFKLRLSLHPHHFMSRGAQRLRRGGLTARRAVARLG